jgi:hypothetical protein
LSSRSDPQDGVYRRNIVTLLKIRTAGKIYRDGWARTGCGRENTDRVDLIDQGSAMVDPSAGLQAEEGREIHSNYSVVGRENGQSGVGFNPDARLQGHSIEGTWCAGNGVA